MALLEIRGLEVAYGSVAVLHGVDLDVDAGEIVALIGANGAGKTTTLRTVSGLLRPRRGSIRFAGQSLVGVAPHEIARRGLAHVPEGRGVFANLSVRENLEIAGRARADSKGFRDNWDEALDLFPRLRDRLTQFAGTLSGGEQQMLAMARALLARPRLLLLDEPSMGLAPQLVQTIFRIIRQIKSQGTTILLIEQNAHAALNVADRAYVLVTGSVALTGDAQSLRQNDEVRMAYLGIAPERSGSRTDASPLST